MNQALTHGVILVIDADLQMASRAADLLGDQGFPCCCAADAEAARRAVRQLTLDLILCDVQLPSGSGIELSRKLLQESGQSDVPVMFLSSSQLPDIVHRVHESRGAYYLRNPYDPEVLVEIVARALWIPEASARPPRSRPPAATSLPHLTRRLRNTS